MALGDVIIKDTDGNIGFDANVAQEKISAMIFDVSRHPDLFTSGYGKNNSGKLKLGDICYITNLKSAINDFGIIEYVEPTGVEADGDINFMHGIPYYHISEFFRMNGGASSNARLYVMFADLSLNFDAVELIQRAAKGMISQLGVWTEQPLWKLNGETYTINLIRALNEKAEALTAQHQPLSILLHANSGNVGVEGNEGFLVDINKIPSCIVDARRVSVLIGQANQETVHKMQLANPNHTPVGFMGAALGSLAFASVHESIAWVQKFNLFDDNFQNIEFGFGDLNIGADGEFGSTNLYESISPIVLDDLDDKGYIFPIKYAGRENGIYISKDQTCSRGDYRTIARNRVINKCRRRVREALLPSVNSPIYVDPATGFMSPSKVTAFTNLVDAALQPMLTNVNPEISGRKITIDPKQSILKNDKVQIKFSVVPVGTSSMIEVEESLSLTNR